MKTTLVSLVASLMVLSSSVPALGVPLPGVLDNFQDSTTQGWTSGAFNPNPPVNVGNGGPVGAGDAYLQVTGAGGFGAGGKPTTFNTAQWIGDYAAAGVTAVQLDAINLGASSIVLRFLLEGPGGRFYTAGVPLGAASGWKTIVFPVDAAGLAGGVDVAATRANVTKVRIFHNPSPAYPGPDIVATYGVDNIAALTGPPIAGDANLDGHVDLQDFSLLKANFGATVGATWGMGNFNADGAVDLQDFSLLKANFGTGGASVPEPTIMSLIALGGVSLMRRRRC